MIINLTPVEHVSGWKTSDGKIHSHEKTALEHQLALDFHAWCEATICRGGEWTARMVAREILTHWAVAPLQEQPK